MKKTQVSSLTLVALTDINLSISNSKENKKKDSACPLWISDDLEFWPEPAPRFCQIATLYSELIALSSNGQLYQWKWNEHEPYKHPEVSVSSIYFKDQ